MMMRMVIRRRMVVTGGDGESRDADGDGGDIIRTSLCKEHQARS